jgi:hypothetical protein
MSLHWGSCVYVFLLALCCCLSQVHCAYWDCLQPLSLNGWMATIRSHQESMAANRGGYGSGAQDNNNHDSGGMGLGVVSVGVGAAGVASGGWGSSSDGEASEEEVAAGAEALLRRLTGQDDVDDEEEGGWAADDPDDATTPSSPRSALDINLLQVWETYGDMKRVYACDWGAFCCVLASLRHAQRCVADSSTARFVAACLLLPCRVAACCNGSRTVSDLDS